MAMPAKLTGKRLQAALGAFRKRGMYTDAARAARVHPSTLWHWRKSDPEVQARFDGAEAELVERIGRKAITAVEQHLDDVLAGKRRSDRYGIVQKEGKTLLIQKGETIELNVNLVRTALMRYEPAWVQVAELSDRVEAMETWMREVVAQRNEARSSDTPPAPVLTLATATNGESDDAT